MSTPIPSVPTAARTQTRESSHWYYPDGLPCYTVPRSEGKGTRATTLRDARKLGLLPSVTTILRLLHKEALERWKIEQAVLAVVTAPRLPNEADDAFITRVLQIEEQHEQEAQVARDRGTEIHEALESYLVGMQVSDEILPWIGPAAEAIKAFGKIVNTEENLVGPGYAGRTDLLQEEDTHLSMTDFKGSKKLPDPNKGGAWPEHRLQLAAYAKAKADMRAKQGMDEKPIILRNVYISTVNQGEYVICEHEEDWKDVFARGFAPLVMHWQWATGYTPPNALTLEQVLTEAGVAVGERALPAGEPSRTVQPGGTAKPSPVVRPQPAPAPSNGPRPGRKVVVTHGVRVSPTGQPMPLPQQPPRESQ